MSLLELDDRLLIWIIVWQTAVTNTKGPESFDSSEALNELCFLLSDRSRQQMLLHSAATAGI
jgi:hypothetical protein